MSRFLINIIFSFLLFGCSNKKKVKPYQLKQVYASVHFFAPHTAVGIKKDSMFLLADLWHQSFTSDKHEYGYILYVQKGDSLIMDTTWEEFALIPDDNPKHLYMELKNWNAPARPMSIYINDLFTHKFFYDKIPDTINKLFPAIKHIYTGEGDTCKNMTAWKYKYFDSIAVCVVIDGIYKTYLCVYDFTTMNSFTIPVLTAPAIKNFFLFDIMGDKKPEIFLFNLPVSDYLSLSDLNIYEIEEKKEKHE